MEYICYNEGRGGTWMAVSKIKVARVQLDLTQQQLAEKVGVTRQTISLIEKGNITRL